MSNYWVGGIKGATKSQIHSESRGAKARADPAKIECDGSDSWQLTDAIEMPTPFPHTCGWIDERAVFGGPFLFYYSSRRESKMYISIGTWEHVGVTGDFITPSSFHLNLILQP